MKLSIKALAVLLAVAMTTTFTACKQPQKKAAATTVEMTNTVPANPFLWQDSDDPIIHFDVGQTDGCALPMWKGNYTVTEDMMDFVPLSPAIHSTLHKAYPDGSQVLLTTGNSEVAKIKITPDRHLKMIGQLVIPGEEKAYFSPTTTAALVKQMDANYSNEEGYLKAFSDLMDKRQIAPGDVSGGVYSLIDKDGFLYAGSGTRLFKYGDANDKGADAPLEIEGMVDIRDHMSPELAKTVTRFLGINMTYDGYIVVAMPGVVGVVSRDLQKVWLAPIPGENVDNGICLDDKGGIYVVTDKFMRKMVWTGNKLSMDEADGAWSELYAYDKTKKGYWLSRGAGATPTCMGFGDNEDRLVVLSDAGNPVKIIAFWRDSIPADAKQVEGAKTKRMASAVKIDFPVTTTIEWSMQSYKNGIFTFASDFPDPVLSKKDYGQLLTLLTMGNTRKGPLGAQCFEWDNKEKTLKSRWLYTDRTFVWTLSPVSHADNAVYMNTMVDGEYIIIGKDWNTGEQVAEIHMPNTFKLNTFGQFVYPLRNGDLVVGGTFGPVLIRKPANP